jgi:ferrous iron transport protein B
VEVASERCVLVIGKESVGKSQLIASLTGQPAASANFRGTTLSVDAYYTPERTFVDTPGIIRQSDSVTTRETLARLQESDTILLVIHATHIDDDLDDLLPLVAGKRGAIAVTFWDKVRADSPVKAALERLSRVSGLPFIPVDARHLSGDDHERLLAAIDRGLALPGQWRHERIGWRLEPRPTVLEQRYLGPLLALVLLMLPAVMAVWMANTVAAAGDALVKSLLHPAVQWARHMPSPVRDIAAGPYGLLSMGPLLFVWAVPTVVLYALFLGIYKASGLIDRISVALHPWLRSFGLSGRDLVRILMGFGCNVPAVLNTRACSGCSRDTCIATLAFGSACSYQFGATLAVFSTAGVPGLVVPYLGLLAVTTLVYARFVAPPQARSPRNLLLLEGRCFLAWPRWPAIWREARGTLSQFFGLAIPIFCTITVIASLLDWLGIIPALARLLGPAMTAVRLPAEAALPIIMASIRKDGILLFAESHLLATMTPFQLLAGVYLAGVMFPCMVTVLAIAREKSWRFSGRLIARQMLAAIAFVCILVWSAALFA